MSHGNETASLAIYLPLFSPPQLPADNQAGQSSWYSLYGMEYGPQIWETSDTLTGTRIQKCGAGKRAPGSAQSECAKGSVEHVRGSVGHYTSVLGLSLCCC